ncbi:MAG: redoxin domain-containing protein [Planctomycetota bacterium]
MFRSISSALLFCIACLGTVVAFGQDRESPLKVGERAPDFELPVQGSDEYVKLSEQLRQGPVVVIVLRGNLGYQCSICKQQYGSFINRARSLAKAMSGDARRVLMIYPGEEKGLESAARQFVGSRQLPEPLLVLRDPGMAMVRDWGLRWDERRETAYPATYVIGPGQRVKWSKVSRSHAGRASVQDVLKALDNLP